MESLAQRTHVSCTDKYIRVFEGRRGLLSWLSCLRMKINVATHEKVSCIFSCLPSFLLCTLGYRVLAREQPRGEDAAPGVDQLRQEVQSLRQDVDTIRSTMHEMHREVQTDDIRLSSHVHREIPSRLLRAFY